MTAIYRKAQLSNIAAVAFQLDSATPDNPTFVPADGLFVYNPDYKINPETITREGSRADISPMGVRTARKTATLTFSTELRAEGNYAARCGLGKLLLACGYEEHDATGTTAAARTITPIKNSDNTGTVSVSNWTIAGTAANDRLCDFKIKALKAGASGTAELRVTGGVAGTNTATEKFDNNVGQSEVITGWIDKVATTGTFAVVVGGTYNAPTFTFSGTPATGDVINLVILGRDVTYTVLSGDTKTAAAMALKIETAINGDVVVTLAAGTAYNGSVPQGQQLFTADSTDAVVTIDFSNTFTYTVPIGPASGDYSAGDIISLTVYNTTFSYTCPATKTPTEAADALAALIADDTRFTGTANTDAAITLAFSTGNAPAGEAVAVTTNTTYLYLGQTGISLKPVFTGSFVAGDAWMVPVVPAGFYYKPISQNMKDASIALYLDGTTHKMTRAKGTFTFDAKAGGTGVMNFTFTGNYHDPIDQADEDPVAVLVNELPPPIFELAYFSYNQYPHYAAENFTFDQGNEVVIRPNYNAAEGYYGILITSRTPSGSFDPEAARIHEVDMWTPFADSSYAPLRIRFGTETGNTIWMYAPATQVSENTYGDRNKIRTISTKLNFARAGEGNNEVIFAIA